MTNLIAKPLRSIAFLLSTAFLGGTAGASCPSQNWDSAQPIVAQQLQPETRWSYTAGEDLPISTLRLLRADMNEAEYDINGETKFLEQVSTYSEINPLRKGEKIIVRFPLKLGDDWTDEFSEEGEYRNSYEHYYYDYHESSSNSAAAIENITVAAGTFKAMRIDRIAYWTKSNPRAAEGGKVSRQSSQDEVKVSGVTLTQIWYVPSIGRAVLKAQLRLGHPLYARSPMDLLQYANSAIVELTEFEQGPNRCANKKILQARQPEMYAPIGYAVVYNDTWEWALQMREHYPRRQR